jgi:uncharacterized phage infection (PIP) family protein YhgE
MPNPKRRKVIASQRKHRKHRGMKMATSDSKTPSPETETHEVANVDKIRDIIFGSQMRDYEKRFARLEERLTADAQNLREDIKKRFDTLEAFVQKEVDSLGQRLKAEKSERSEALKESTREYRDTAKTIEKKLSQLDDQLAKEAAGLRSLILDQSKQLTAEIEAKHRALSSALDREAQSLRTDKADREAVADLFTEMAMRLRNEIELPKGK